MPMVLTKNTIVLKAFPPIIAVFNYTMTGMQSSMGSVQSDQTVMLIMMCATDAASMGIRVIHIN